MDPTAHHYGITVSDLDRSIAFYRDVLGMTVADRFSMDPDRFGDLLGVDDGQAEVAFLDGFGFRLELEEHAKPNGNVNERTTPSDVGYPHLCLEVDNIEDAYRSLRDDADFVSPPGQASESGAKICYFRDPDGNLIELIESPSA
ncbi:VOC family protein [Natrinema halophilum]|uniref:VOC family protein n=1 Tax=Natrinema halophilum TaxID=1699371 RepID=A0A7D5GMB4_9EURY|nr:VOC family protein [Natrinema halophilum]QLG49992.1 VOC family protein [Natrinema halophilum]